MKLPLLLHGKPNSALGPTVWLEQGKWRIESNHKDSTLEIILNGLSFRVIDDETNKLDFGEEGATCRLVVNTPGTEDELTVYAVRL